MIKQLLFGAAYYEEYLPDDRLERDMELMAAAGMNTIRIAESTWSVEESRCGAFDFSRVMRVIDAAARHGLNVIVGTPTYAIPVWLAALDPEIWRTYHPQAGFRNVALSQCDRLSNRQ